MSNRVCKACGASEFTQRDGKIVCEYCNTPYTEESVPEAEQQNIYQSEQPAQQEYQSNQQGTSQQDYQSNQQGTSQQDYQSNQQGTSQQGYQSNQQGTSQQGYQSNQQSTYQQGYQSNQQGTYQQGTYQQGYQSNPQGTYQQGYQNNTQGTYQPQGGGSIPGGMYGQVPAQPQKKSSPIVWVIVVAVVIGVIYLISRGGTTGGSLSADENKAVGEWHIYMQDDTRIYDGDLLVYTFNSDYTGKVESNDNSFEKQTFTWKYIDKESGDDGNMMYTFKMTYPSGGTQNVIVYKEYLATEIIDDEITYFKK